MLNEEFLDGTGSVPDASSGNDGHFQMASASTEHP
jgi:hypothetical protein